MSTLVTKSIAHGAGFSLTQLLSRAVGVLRTTADVFAEAQALARAAHARYPFNEW
jgi:hypothetical protein